MDNYSLTAFGLRKKRNRELNVAFLKISAIQCRWKAKETPYKTFTSTHTVTLVRGKRFQNKQIQSPNHSSDFLSDTFAHQSDSYLGFYRQQISTTHLWSFDLAVAPFTISEYGVFCAVLLSFSSFITILFLEIYSHNIRHFRLLK